MESDATRLARSDRSFVLAPAGCGKTELIAQAVDATPGRSLVLTHTHSGVNALRSRLERLGIRRDKAEISTIAGFALRYASAFPRLSGLTIDKPSRDEWNLVYEAAIQVLSRRVVIETLARSFRGVYVDEYQDCSLLQHPIILGIADLLPCRLLGDPLQAIFDFAGPSISWRNDVLPQFERLPDMTVPHRWAETNPELGDWLMSIRRLLVEGQSIDLARGPVRWVESTPQNIGQVCIENARIDSESVVVVRKWPNDSHDLASRLGGRYSSMEELDCHRLMDFARSIDESEDGSEIASHLLDLAGTCFTRIGPGLSTFADQYRAGRIPATARLGANRPYIESLNQLAEEPSMASLIRSVRILERYPGAHRYRRELWNEMKTSVLSFERRTHESLADTAWYVRDRARRSGRRPENRIVSRTLLIKGLEFDRAVVVASDNFNAKEFYVAVTRGRSAVTVLSPSPTVQYPSIDNVLPAYAG